MGRHRDMRQHCDLQTAASSGAVVTCVAGTCAPAPRSTTLEVTAPGTCHCVCVCVSGVARISTDGLLHVKHVKQRLVAPGKSSIISIHIYIAIY